MSDAVAARQRMRFRLMRGRHIDREGDPKVNDGKRVFQAKPNAPSTLPDDERFPIIETSQDLAAMFNGPHDKMAKFKPVTPIKTVEIDPTFRRPGETVQSYLARLNEFAAKAQAQSANLIKQVDSMSVEQLKELAEGEEIDLEKAKNIDDMRRIIKSVLKG